MDLKTCSICEARWIDGQHYWSTGALGNESDLAGLVCNRFRRGREGCINPMLGSESGDTWEKRAAKIEAFSSELMVKPSSEIDISYEHLYKDVPSVMENYDED